MSSADHPDSFPVASELVCMSPQHKQTLLAACEKFVVNVNITSILIPLISQNVLSMEEDQKLQSLPTENEKASYFLLHLLPYKPDSAFDTLIRILRNNRQEHVAALLEEQSTNKLGLQKAVAYDTNGALQLSSATTQDLFKRGNARLLMLQSCRNFQEKFSELKDILVEEIEREIKLLENLLELAKKRLQMLRIEDGSILCVFCCLDFEGEKNLEEMVTSGELQQIITSIFRCLSPEFAQQHDVLQATRGDDKIMLCIIEESQDISKTEIQPRSRAVVEEKGEMKLKLEFYVQEFKPEEVRVKVLGNNIIQVTAGHKEKWDEGFKLLTIESATPSLLTE